MEEKIILKGKFTSNYYFIGSVIMAILSFLAMMICYFTNGYEANYQFIGGNYVYYGEERLNLFEYMFRNEYPFEGLILFIVTAFFISLAILFYFMYRELGITVTDKRVVGKRVFGIRVDLPVDKISAVSVGWIKSIAVATSSGIIKFLFCENNKEVQEAISNILIERQDKTNEHSSTVKQELSTADELQKFKELLDSGVITEEEFEEKKKQLLGL